MYKAQAVLKTNKKSKFESAGFDIDVNVNADTKLVAQDSVSEMFRYIKEGWCDGFIVQMGKNVEQHFIKADSE